MHNLTFREYAAALPRGGLAHLAARLGISRVYLSQLVARQNDREPSPELCVQIEQVTAGAVTRRGLRPDDWHRIWPELLGDKHCLTCVDATPISAAAAQEA